MKRSRRIIRIPALGADIEIAALSRGRAWRTPENIEPRKKRAVVAVHGYYGSFLETEKGERVFTDFPRLLFARDPLSLYQKELGTPPGPDGLKVGGMIGSVSVLPYMLRSPAYDPLMEGLLSDRAEIVPFAYDWRLDLLDVTRDLEAFLLRLTRAGVEDISLVTHSMGGLVAAYYLRYGSQKPESAQENWAGAGLVKKCVFMGVPFRGVMAVFKNMSRGVNFYSNTSLLPKESVASFPASYYLLPGEGEVQDLSIWEKHSVGLFSEGREISEAQRKARRLFTVERLRRGRLFQSLLHAPLTTATPLPFLNLVGTGRPTHAHFSETMKGLAFFPEEAPHEIHLVTEGDESVSVGSALLPEAYAQGAKAVYTHAAHSALFTDMAALRAIREFLEL